MKGFIDLVYVPILIFVSFLIIFVAVFLFSAVRSGFAQISHLDPNATSIVIERSTWFINFTPYILITLYFAIPISAVLLAFISGSNPVALFVSFILFVVGLLLSAILEDVVLAIIATTQDLYFLLEHPILNILINNFTLIMSIFYILLIIAQVAYKIV